jgi:hypothetical protein
MALEMSKLTQLYPEASDGTSPKVADPPTYMFGMTPPALAAFRPAAITDRKQYDPKIAYLTTVVSAWAYSDAETMASQLGYFGLPKCSVREFKVTNGAMLVVAAAYFVRSEDGRIGVLAFRGTVPDNFINWLTDANASLKNFHHGNVHCGFYRNLEPLWNEIARTIDAARQPGQGSTDGGPALQPLENLYITGHSLGAAMAVVAAARIFTPDYVRWQPLVRGVYTFGQPCVGDKAFCDHFSREFELYRHVYAKDIVPCLPPSSLRGFRHFGTAFVGSPTSDGWQESTVPAKRAPFLLLGMASAMADYTVRKFIPVPLPFPYSIEDHGPQGYLDTARASLR